MVSIVAEMTGYPAELLDLDLDLEADLGVDTVKQAEVFAAVRERFNVERDENLQLRDFPTLTHVIAWVREKTGIQPAAAAARLPCGRGRLRPGADEVTDAVVSIVAEMTGYPAELLDLDLDLEADLASTRSSRRRCSRPSASGSTSNATRTSSCVTSRR